MSKAPQSSLKSGHSSPAKSPSKSLAYLALAAALVVVDFSAKLLAYEYLSARSMDILPIFKLALVFNRGAAFGFLSDAGGWQHGFFIAVAVVVSVALAGWLWRDGGRNALLCCALALVLAGAVGNLIDRVSYGFVIDFIVLHYGGWYFPAFNLADAAISIGAVLLVIDNFRPRRGRRS